MLGIQGSGLLHDVHQERNGNAQAQTGQQAAQDHHPPADGLLDGKHLECRMPGRDGAELVIAGVWPSALEEDPYLRLPPLEVGAQHWHFLIVSELPAAKTLGAPAQPQLAHTDGHRR
jgi:hypothetical protein